MRGAIVVTSAAWLLASPALAQHWVPPKPGQDTCSGWDTPEAQATCRAREVDEQARHDDVERGRYAKLKAAADAAAQRVEEQQKAEAARVASAHAAAEQAQAADAARAAEARAAAERQRALREEREKAEADARAVAEADEERQLGGPSPRGFALRYRTFAASHFDNAHFVGPPPLQSHDCEDAQPDQSYTCYFSVGSTVDVDAETEVGSDRLARVELAWGGDDRRRDLFALTAGYVVGALSPEAPAGTWSEIADRIYGDLPGAPFRFPPRAWSVGRWHYRLWHDDRFGARNVVRFEATRDPS